MKKLYIFILIALVFPVFSFAQENQPTPVLISELTSINCVSPTECEEMKEELVLQLRQIISALLARIQEIQIERAQAVPIEQIDVERLDVNPDGSLDLYADRLPPRIALEVWSIFQKIAPLEYIRDYVIHYEYYYDEDDDTAAFVEQDQDTNNKWRLGVNLYWANNLNQENERDLIETLIHEFAHVLTLNPTQIDENASFRSCREYEIQEGCLESDAYLNLFVEQFWSDNDFDHQEELEDEDNLEEQLEIAEEYFADNEDRFVTSYATTNPAEDIAESFAQFVLQPTPRIGSIADQKVAFFYSDQDLVELRSSIREFFNTVFNF